MILLKTLKNKIALVLIATLIISMLIGAVSIQPVKAALPLNPATIPKYVTPLVAAIPTYTPTNVTVGGKLQQNYYINVTQFTEIILPASMGLSTTVWGYGGNATLNGTNIGYFRNSPSATFDVIRNVPTKITWVNNLTDATVSNNLLNYLYPVDPTLDWANPNNIPANTAMTLASLGLAPPYPPGYNGTAILVGNTYTNPFAWNANSPVPIVTHVHGAEVYSGSDGGPNEWFTPNGLHGMDYYTYEPTSPNAAVYYYNNTNEESTLWYHDHAMGVTRINVFSGLAGYYIIRDPASTIAPLLPNGTYDVPLAIQDRAFYDNGNLRFDIDPPTNPSVHPYWVPEYFGDTMMVNGKTWPYFNVTQTTYRFRLLDGCNARFLNLTLRRDDTNATVPFTLIARDQGYLKTAVVETSQLIGPGMRAEILVNFTGIPAGTNITMWNNAAAPYPTGTVPDPNTVGQVMRFCVRGPDANPQFTLPTILNAGLSGTFPTLPNATVTRERLLTLKEVMGPGGPLMVTLDGQQFGSPTSELPVNGTTEDWVIANPTADAHPMHWHLASFQLISRQPFDDVGYTAAWTALNGEPPFNKPTINVGNLSSYFTGPAVPAPPEEQGWLDTVTMLPGQVTTMRIRLAQQNGTAFPFDPTTGQGYVWHCHIVDHEDNEMMRRMTPILQSQLPPMYGVVHGTDNRIYYRTYSFGTASWNNWNALPSGTTTTSPATTSYGGKLYFVVKGDFDTGLYFSSLNLTDLSFTGWAKLSGSTPSAPTLVNYGSKLLLIVRGTDNGLWYRYYDTITNTWGGWIGIPETQTSDSPAATVIGTTMSLVVRGFSTTSAIQNNTLWYSSLNLFNNDFSGWKALPGETDAAPRLTSPENENTLYLAIKGTDNVIYMNKNDGTTWLGWTAIPNGSTLNSPAATVVNGELQILVRGTYGNTLWQYYSNLANGISSGWKQLDGTTTSAPAISR